VILAHYEPIPVRPFRVLEVVTHDGVIKHSHDFSTAQSACYMPDASRNTDFRKPHFYFMRLNGKFFRIQ